MAQELPTLLFIGRNGDADQAWLTVRRIWQPGKALRASQAYAGMGLLLKHNHLRLVVVGVDQLSQAEMSFFSAASRRYPQLQLLAFGKGDELSNPRLADATWHGATEALSSEQLPQKLSQLRQQRRATAAGELLGRQDRSKKEEKSSSRQGPKNQAAQDPGPSYSRGAPRAPR